MGFFGPTPTLPLPIHQHHSPTPSPDTEADWRDPNLGSEEKQLPLAPEYKSTTVQEPVCSLHRGRAFKQHMSSWNLTQKLRWVSHLRNTKQIHLLHGVPKPLFYHQWFSKVRTRSSYSPVIKAHLRHLFLKDALASSQLCMKKAKRNMCIFIETCSRGIQHP